MGEHPTFEVTLQRPCDHLVLIDLKGDVDIYSASQFKEALFQAIGEGAVSVIIDFARVPFVDSTALGVVVGGVKLTQAQGGTLDIVCPQESIRSIFETTGLDRVLGVYRSRAEALAGVQQQRPAIRLSLVRHGRRRTHDGACDLGAGADVEAASYVPPHGDQR
jgi:anti-sigma B factor antagonist